eukprot:TRINITY_DN6172_c0_g1_i6.p1 TRINITY_DN6172_c0_g1~~TRINITY_DN6172_c0_g1_i6.p1  ORF type:complete len:400 (-),score=-1.37 TRINITY_DN6172_c0_g1_i6:226-1326(-)
MSQKFTDLKFQNYVFMRITSTAEQRLLYTLRTSSKVGKKVFERHIHTGKVDLQNITNFGKDRSLIKSIKNLMVFIPKYLNNISELQFFSQEYFRNTQIIQVIFKSDDSVHDSDYNHRIKHIHLIQNFDIQNLHITGKFGIKSIQIHGHYNVSITNSYFDRLNFQIYRSPHASIKNCKFKNSTQDALCCCHCDQVNINGLYVKNTLYCACYISNCAGQCIIKNVHFQGTNDNYAIQMKQVQEFYIKNALIKNWSMGINFDNCMGELKIVSIENCRIALFLYNKSVVILDPVNFLVKGGQSNVVIEGGSKLQDRWSEMVYSVCDKLRVVFFLVCLLFIFSVSYVFFYGFFNFIWYSNAPIVEDKLQEL